MLRVARIRRRGLQRSPSRIVTTTSCDTSRYSLRHPLHPGDTVSRVIASNTPLMLERLTFEHVANAAASAEHFELLRRLQLHSVMIVPIATPLGRVLGAITVASAESGREFRHAAISTCLPW